MKNSILTVLMIASLAACKKSETVVVDNATDSTAMMNTMDSSTSTENAMDAPEVKDASTLTAQDKSFVDAAAKGGMLEVMLGQIAEKNAASENVKEFGKMMVEDHGKANAELKSWATAANYTLPASLDGDQQKMVNELNAKTGAAFDKAYTNMMVEDHKKDIDAFKKESIEGTGDVKAFATKMLPVLQVHLDKIQQVKMIVK